MTEVQANRERFIVALREAYPARQCQGQMFGLPLTPEGPVRLCASGVAAELFLGIHNLAEYNAFADVQGRNAYREIAGLLGLDTEDDIYILNDGTADANTEGLTFAEIADVLEERWAQR